jgi:hypothetical protein
MPDTAPSTLKFHYIKSNFYRVVHVDGAIGGLTPNRQIFISLFNERSAIPQILEYKVLPEGDLGDEVNRVGKDGLVRELETGIILNVHAAEALGKLLLAQANILRESKREEQQHEPAPATEKNEAR